MKKIEIYEAFDGTRFDSPTECFEYEKPIKTVRHNLMYSITLKDEEGNVIKLPYSSDDSDYDIKFENALNRADTCEIEEDLYEESINYLNENIGQTIPPKKGLYRYDWSSHEWISYEKDINEFLTNWHITFDELVRMGN